MELVRENVGKVAILNQIIYDLNSLIENNEITKSESFGILRRVNKQLSSFDGEIIPVDKISYDSIITTSQIKDIVDSINYNYIYYAAEIDLLNSVSKVVSAYVDGEIDKAKEEISNTSTLVNIMKNYLTAKSNNIYAVQVLNSDMIGDFDIIDNYIVSSVSSTKQTGISEINISTNGLIGNMLELDKSVELYTPLEDSEVLFIDEKNIFLNKARLKDTSEDTVFEVEAYKVLDNVVNDLLLLTIKKKYEDSVYKTVDWNKAPENNILTLTVTLKTASQFNTIVVSPYLINTYQKVRSVSVSVDGVTWNTIAENIFLVPEINAFDERYSLYKGNGVFYNPFNSCQYAMIVFEQDTPYLTHIAHCLYHREGSTVSEPGEEWCVTTDNKTDFFKSDTITMYDGLSYYELGKDAMAIEANRWSISLKEVKAINQQYNRETIITSKTYNFNGNILNVSIDTESIIPSGTSVKYELSHDDGVTWNKINPVSSSGGVEILSFSSSENYLDDTSVSVIQVDELPRSIKLRITIKTDKNNSPAIKNIIINPVLSMEN